MKNILYLISISLLLSSCSKSDSNLDPNSADLKKGLQVYYPFSNNANDASGNGFNGTMSKVSLIKDRFNNNNAAMNFSGGLGSKISTNYKGVTGNQSRTISFWYRRTANYSNSMPILFYGGDPYYNEDIFGIYVQEDKRMVGISLNRPDNTFRANYFEKIIDNNWHQYAFSFDNTNGNSAENITMYIDGILVANNVGGGFNRANFIINTKSTIPLVFGEKEYNGQVVETFRGDLDDVGIWNRSLSQTEISYLFNNDFKP